MPLGVSNLFEIWLPAYVLWDLLAQPGCKHPQKPVLVSEILACLRSIRLINFSVPWKPCLRWYFKSLVGILQ